MCAGASVLLELAAQHPQCQHANAAAHARSTCTGLPTPRPSAAHQPAVLATLPPPHFTFEVLVVRVEHPRRADRLQRQQPQQQQALLEGGTRSDVRRRTAAAAAGAGWPAVLSREPAPTEADHVLRRRCAPGDEAALLGRQQPRTGWCGATTAELGDLCSFQVDPTHQGTPHSACDRSAPSGPIAGRFEDGPDVWMSATDNVWVDSMQGGASSSEYRNWHRLTCLFGNWQIQVFSEDFCLYSACIIHPIIAKALPGGMGCSR